MTTYPKPRLISLFAGVGGFGLAAEAAGRRYVGVELDPTYVAVTLERFAERGLTPVRQEQEPTT